jgi:predicted aspartyl protease
MIFTYSSDYFPPAPIIDISLGVPAQELALGPIAAFVDTGADITLIPARYINQLALPVDDHRFLRSQWGERRRVMIYSVDMGIGLARLPAVEVVADDRSAEIILGRNVLNKLVVTLNGPQRTIEVRG